MTNPEKAREEQKIRKIESKLIMSTNSLNYIEEYNDIDGSVNIVISRDDLGERKITTVKD